MDDMSAFERQLAERLQQLAGPEPTVDVTASVRAATSSSARWTFSSMFSAARFVVAGAIVTLFGGFLLSGMLTTQPAGGPIPGAASPSLSNDPLSSMATEPVEPGVRRVVNDGVRDLEWDATATPARAELVASDGHVWVIHDDAIRVGAEGSHAVGAAETPPYRVTVDADGSVALIEAGYELPPTFSRGPWAYAIGPGRVAWEQRNAVLRRHTQSGVEVFTGDDDIPRFEGLSPLVGPRMVVAPDASAWFSLYAANATGSDCGGVVHYDGQASTYFLQDRGFCVSAMDVDGGGRLWVLGYTHHFGSDEPDDYRERLYVIDASGTDLDRQQRENDMDERMSPRATAVAAMGLATALATATAPAVTAQDTQPTMSEFSGRLGCGTAGPSSEAVSWRFPVVEISDERFDGTYVNQLAGYEDGDPDVDGVGAYAALWEITTEEGGWVGQTATFRFPPESYSTTSVALEGHGAYAGLTAIMEGDFTEDCGFDIRGVVVEGDLPVTPEAVMAAE